ncbi:MAG: hypothetical protein K2H29_08530 [Oscillospiraceae bacterium]|nr:hypothetical protein [Oscillospiraceae bacterium]
MYTVKREKTCTSLDGNGNIKTCYLMHITVDAIADIPDAKENWLAGSRCDVLEDGGHVYMLSNSREWVKVNFHNLGGEGGSTDLSDYYTMSQTDERITEKIAEIVADAPEDFDTLKELSNWIYSHEDSAAAMNTQIQQNTTDISQKVDKIPGMGLSQNSFTDAEKTKLDELTNYDDSEIKSNIAINNSSIGLQRKNLLKVNGKSETRSGINFNYDTDGILNASGTQTGSFTHSVYIDENGLLFDRDVIISYTGETNVEARLKITSSDNSNTYPELTKNGLLFPKNTKLKQVYFQRTSGTKTVNISNFGVMVRYAEIEDDTYEPYRPSVAEYIENLEARISALENNQQTNKE